MTYLMVTKPDADSVKFVADTATFVAYSPTHPFLRNFGQYSVVTVLFGTPRKTSYNTRFPWSPKQHRTLKKMKTNNVADIMPNLISACCIIRLQFTSYTVWPDNVCF